MSARRTSTSARLTVDIAPVEAAVLAVDVHEIEPLRRQDLDRRRRGECHVDAADQLSRRGRVLDGPVLANFDKDRERVDSIITRSSPRVAQSQR